jgi:uncharacterized protein (TIGR02246 family)
MDDLCPLYSDAWAGRDPDAIAALHTPDTVFHLHSAGQEPVRGREAVRDTFAGFLALIPDLTYEQVSLRTTEDGWVAEWRMRGTTPDGRTVDADLVDVITVKDGLVHTKDSYADALTLQEQLGLTRAGAPA